jgi:hypothetical protein
MNAPSNCRRLQRAFASKVYRKSIPDRKQSMQSFFGIVISLKLYHRQVRAPQSLAFALAAKHQ